MENSTDKEKFAGDQVEKVYKNDSINLFAERGDSVSKPICELSPSTTENGKPNYNLSAILETNIKVDLNSSHSTPEEVKPEEEIENELNLCAAESTTPSEQKSHVIPEPTKHASYSEKRTLTSLAKESDVLIKGSEETETEVALLKGNEEFGEIDAEIDDALDEGYMGMECTLERGFSLNESALQKDLWFDKYEEISPNYVHKKFPYRYSSSLKHLIPVRKASRNKDEMKIDKAGLFSFMSFAWMTGLMWKAYKHGLIEDDVPLCSEFEKCHPNTQRLSSYWEEEVKKKGLKNATLHWPIWHFIRTRLILALVILIFSLIFGFIGPTFFMRYLIDWLSTDEPVTVGITWSFCLIICEGMRVILFAVVWGLNYRTGIRLRAACLGLVYKKLMSLSHLGNKSIGEVINLFANDGQRIFDFVTLGTFFISGPLVAIAGVVYILLILGPWALLGMTSFLLFYPCQYIISRLSGHLRKKTVTITDQRVRLMNEIFACIKLIKMYAWEKCFAKSVAEIRKEERQYLEKAAYVQSVSLAMTPTVPVLAAIITFLSHIGAGYNLTASQAFPIVAFLLVPMRTSLNMMRFSVLAIVEYRESQKRLQNLLCMKEMENYVDSVCEADTHIYIKEATFAWDVEETEGKNTQNKRKIRRCKGENDFQLGQELFDRDQRPPSTVVILHDLNFQIKKGELVGVCGGIGSGKSSLLLGILGQMSLRKGNVCVSGKCAYVGQVAWILNATLRENILLGEDFDAKRYYKVMYACSLTEDVAVLPGGDNTEIGERGINLSGGQKQRVSLARALYSNKDIYFLDDCLSAVDAHVGQHMFQWVFKTALKHKTVVFVTHQLQYLPECDRVIHLRKGRIAEMGKHSELMAAGDDYSTLFKKHLETINKEKRESKKSPHMKESNSFLKPEISIFSSANDETVEMLSTQSDLGKAEGGHLTSPEENERGDIPRSVYLKYIVFCGGFVVANAVILTFILNAASVGFSSWWLSVWLNAGSGNMSIIVGNETVISTSIGDNPDIEYYRTIYGLSIVFILATSLIRGFALMKTTIMASSRMHATVFEKVFRSPMSFFETTPSGRVINLFSRDMDEADVRLPMTMETFLQNIWLILISLLFVSVVFPYFLIFLVLLAAMFLFIRHVFKHGVRDLKRFENTSRSPIFTYINTTVNGLQSIQAFHKQKMFTQRFMRLFDDNSSTFYLFNAAVRWLAIRLDLLALSVSTITAFFCVLFRNSVGVASAGLALAYASQLSGIFQYTVRLSTETEARFTSVQRIITYIETLEPEAPLIVKGNRPNKNWPKFGRISFKKVELKYRAETPLALKGVSFEIDSQEKIGVIGRTGSGKSSLGVALFRLAELKRGSIFIDGINIATVGLKDLRSRLSIIPQDPILFIGTVRYNLDPFECYSDNEVWGALEKTHMKTTISALGLNLSSPVVENGNNFSVGERQLLCMARALLRKSKILFLDEATSGIDTETDSKIQCTLKEAFKDCTMITVAHRLNTIMSCSRVMVMDNGSLAEFDSPENLLVNSASRFSKLIAASQKGLYSI